MIIRHLLIFIMLWQALFKASNTAIGCLLKFMAYFLGALGKLFGCKQLNEAGAFIPMTPGTVHKILGIEQKDFIEYVVCPQCDSIYKYENTFITLANGKKQSLKCSYVAMPNHPFPTQCQPCGAILPKTVKTKCAIKLIPVNTAH